jgi:prepilin-type N-terminal cleavage/methylation domain-containing protein
MIEGKRQKAKGKRNKDGWRARFPVLPFAFFLLPSPARRWRAGMTLVEVMIALGIIAILTSALMSLFMSALWSWDQGSSKGQGDTAVSLAVQKVIRAIADGMTASVSSGQLTVQLPLVNNQGDYDRTQNGNTVKIYLTGTTLYEQINSATATTLSTNITAAAFSVSSSSVTVTLTAKGQTGERVMTTQLSQGVALRNYSAP